MDNKQRIQLSKYLSKHLRHTPEDLGLALLPGGWVYIEDLLAGAREDGFPIAREQLLEVVARDEKQRFGLDERRGLIRANQGHTTEVDLQLEPQAPPDVLYHGTGQKYVPLIQENGLQKMDRHHVHLSLDVPTALKVGQRKGRPVVLVVAAGSLHAAGQRFYCSANNVWLVEEVPAAYLTPLASTATS